MNKRCQSCGTPFVAKRATAIYCSGRCRTRETRARQAGDPRAIPARPTADRPAPAPGLVALVVTPDLTVEVPAHVAAKLAPHLPALGEREPWDTDLRPPWVQEREQLAREAAGEGAAETAAEAVSAGEALLSAAETARAAAAGDGASFLRHGSGVVTGDDVLAAAAALREQEDAERAAERRQRAHDAAQREALHSETEEQLWESLQSSHSIASATRAELAKAGRLATAGGRTAMVLAMRLDYGQRESGSAMASLARAHAAALTAAVEGAVQGEDPIDKARREMAERMAAAGITGTVTGA